MGFSCSTTVLPCQYGYVPISSNFLDMQAAKIKWCQFVCPILVSTNIGHDVMAGYAAHNSSTKSSNDLRPNLWRIYDHVISRVVRQGCQTTWVDTREGITIESEMLCKPNQSIKVLIKPSFLQLNPFALLVHRDYIPLW